MNVLLQFVVQFAAADGADLSKGAIAGVVIGSVAGALLLLCGCWCCVRQFSRRNQRFQ